MLRNFSKKTLIQSTKKAEVRLKENQSYKDNLHNFLLKKPEANICVVRSVGGIGDILMISPSLLEIKRKFTNCKLTFAIDRHTCRDNYYQLLKNCSAIDHFVDARYVDKKKYDYVVDLSSVCIKFENSGHRLNRIDIFSRHLGFLSMKSKLPFYKVETNERNLVKEKYINTNKLKVALHTASFDLMRTWPVKQYIELIKASSNLPIQFYVFDFNNQSNKWKEFENVTNCSNTTVREMAALIEQMDLFIGPDSGPMHIAGALKKKSIVLFGSIPPEIRINYYINHEAIVHPNLKCLGCMYGPCYFNIKCMRDLSYELVFKKMKEKLKL